MRLRSLAIALAVLAAATRVAAAERPLVVVSVPPQAGLVERLAGGRVEVLSLIPAGTTGESETYSPSPQQLARLSGARLYVRVGHPAFVFEQRWIQPIVANTPTLRTFDLASAPAGAAPSGPCRGDEAACDPHLWTSPRLLRAALPGLRDALGAVLPEARAELAAATAGLDAELAALDAELRTAFADAQRRVVLVVHPALGHFCRDYGLRQLAVEADGKEPTPGQLAALVAEARRLGVRTVFLQRGFSRRTAETVAAALGARVVEIDPFGRDVVAALRALGRAIAESLHHG